MKTTFHHLFHSIAFVLTLVAANAAPAQGRAINGIVSGLMQLQQQGHSHNHGHNYGGAASYGQGHHHGHSHHAGYSSNFGSSSQNYGSSRQRSTPNYNQLQSQNQFQNQDRSQQQSFHRQPQRAELPSWLVGSWQGEQRPGGSTQYEISANGKFTTISIITGTANGSFESGRSSQTVTSVGGGLMIGDKFYRVETTTPGKLTLISQHETIRMERLDPNAEMVQTEPQIDTQPVTAELPAWLVGLWRRHDKHVGSFIEYDIAADGKFVTITYFTGTQYGTYEGNRGTETAKYVNNGLQIGDKFYVIQVPAPGKLTLVSNRETIQIERIDPNAKKEAPIDNTQPVINQVSVNTSTVPAALQGVWFETRNRNGKLVLNKYVFNADGSYDLSQYDVSAEGDVDLARPVAQLSKLASVEKRTIRLDAANNLTLGAGQNFSEGPLAAKFTSDRELGTVLNLGSRTLTRTP